jgi:hypothetical protein
MQSIEPISQLPPPPARAADEDVEPTPTVVVDPTPERPGAELTLEPRRSHSRVATRLFAAATVVALVVAGAAAFEWHEAGSRADTLDRRLRASDSELHRTRAAVVATRGELGTTRSQLQRADAQQAAATADAAAAKAATAALRAQIVAGAAATLGPDLPLTDVEKRCVTDHLLSEWGAQQLVTLIGQSGAPTAAQERTIVAAVGLCVSADASA